MEDSFAFTGIITLRLTRVGLLHRHKQKKPICIQQVPGKKKKNYIIHFTCKRFLSIIMQKWYHMFIWNTEHFHYEWINPTKKTKTNKHYIVIKLLTPRQLVGHPTHLSITYSLRFSFEPGKDCGLTWARVMYSLRSKFPTNTLIFDSTSPILWRPEHHYLRSLWFQKQNPMNGFQNVDREFEFKCSLFYYYYYYYYCNAV